MAAEEKYSWESPHTEAFCRFKLVVSTETKKNCLLFDMEKDPYELHNLVNEPAYAEKIASMQKILESELQ